MKRSFPRFALALSLAFALLGLSGCGNGDGGDANASSALLVEFSPLQGTSTASDSIVIRGQILENDGLIFVSGSVSPIDPDTGRFAITVPLDVGRNDFDVRWVPGDGTEDVFLRQTSITRLPGPHLNVETLAFIPVNNRYVFVENEVDARWLSDFDLLTGERRRLLDLGAAGPADSPISLHWDAGQSRLVIGTDPIRSYDPALDTFFTASPATLPGTLLDISSGPNPVIGFALVDSPNGPRTTGFSFATLAVDTTSLGQALAFPTTQIGHDQLTNRLFSPIVNGGFVQLRRFDPALNEWSPFLTLPDGGLPSGLLAGGCIAENVRRFLVAHERFDDEGRVDALRLISIDIDTGALTTRDLTPPPGYIATRRPAISYDALDGRLHVALGRRFVQVDPVTLETLDELGFLAFPSRGTADRAEEGSAFFVRSRSELIEEAQSEDGDSTLIATNIETGTRRRITTFAPGFERRLLNLDGNDAWCRLAGPGGVSGAILARVSLNGGSEPELLGPAPATMAPNVDLLLARSDVATNSVRVLFANGEIHELDRASGTWTLLQILSLPSLTIWRADEDGDLFGLRREPLLSGMTEFSAFQVNLRFPSVAPLGTGLTNDAPPEFLSGPVRDAVDGSLSAVVTQPGGETGLIRLRWSTGQVDYVPALDNDGFGALGRFAQSPPSIPPRLVRGLTGQRPFVLFRAVEDQARRSLGEIDLDTAASALILH